MILSFSFAGTFSIKLSTITITRPDNLVLVVLGRRIFDQSKALHNVSDIRYSYFLESLSPWIATSTPSSSHSRCFMVSMTVRRRLTLPFCGYTIHSIECVLLKIVYVYPSEYNIQADHICLGRFIYLSVCKFKIIYLSMHGFYPNVTQQI